MFDYEDAIQYYNANHMLVQHFHYSWYELENMIIFERDVILQLVQNYIERKEIEKNSIKNRKR